MRHLSPHPLAALLLILGLALTALPAAAQEELSAIEPEAAALLQRMSDTLTGTQAFTLRAETIREFSATNGQILHFYHTVEIAVRRPDRLKLEVTGDVMGLDLWYDGTRVTLLDRERRGYAVIDAPDRLDSMIETMTQEFQVEFPLADFLYSDPHAALTETAANGFIVGSAMVDGTECRHLAFARGGLSWEVWVEANERALPRRFILTNTALPTTPRFIAEFSQWDLAPTLADAGFTAELPEGAVQVEVLPRREAPQ